MANKAVFMDRDDTLIEDPGYINHPNQVRLLPGAAGSLIQLKKMGYLLIIVSNQSGVARGIVSEEVLEQIHHRLQKLLADEGAYLDAIYYCPYHPDGVVGRYRMESDLRKPNPGMLLKAAEEHDIDLSNSWMIGDSYRDVIAGKRAGCRTILIDSPVKRPVRGPSDPLPDRKAGSLREAANAIRMIHQQQKAEEQRSEKKQSLEEPAQEEIAATHYQPAPPQETPLQEIRPQEEEAVSEEVEQPDIAESPVSVPSPETEQSPERPEAIRPPEPEQEIPPQAAQAAVEPIPQPQPHPHPILEEILHLVRSRNRQDLYEEFSFFRLFAMITEIISLFCLVVSVWFWFDSSRPVSSAQMMVGYALVLQLVTIALLLVKKDR